MQIFTECTKNQEFSLENKFIPFIYINYQILVVLISTPKILMRIGLMIIHKTFNQHWNKPVGEVYLI